MQSNGVLLIARRFRALNAIKDDIWLSRFDYADMGKVLVDVRSLFRQGKKNGVFFLLVPAALFMAYFNVEVSNAPFQSLFVGAEEHVEPVAFDNAPPV